VYPWGVRLGVPPVSPRLSGNASIVVLVVACARRVLLSPVLPTPPLQRPLSLEAKSPDKAPFGAAVT
jgi:hypothetical protein